MASKRHIEAPEPHAEAGEDVGARHQPRPRVQRGQALGGEKGREANSDEAPGPGDVNPGHAARYQGGEVRGQQEEAELEADVEGGRVMTLF